MRIKLTHTTPYHPQGNGAVERFNRTLKAMISKLNNVDKWDKSLQTLVKHYNSHVCDATGFSPFQLMFGRKCNFSISPLITPTPFPSTNSYLSSLKNDLKRYWDAARKTIETTNKKKSKTYCNNIRRYSGNAGGVG